MHACQPTYALVRSFIYSSVACCDAHMCVSIAYAYALALPSARFFFCRTQADRPQVARTAAAVGDLRWPFGATRIRRRSAWGGVRRQWLEAHACTRRHARVYGHDCTRVIDEQAWRPSEGGDSAALVLEDDMLVAPSYNPTQTCLNTSVPTCVHAFVRTCARTCARTCVRTCASTCVHTGLTRVDAT